MPEQVEKPKPKMPQSASEAATALLSFLPRVKHNDGMYYYGYYKDGNPTFIPSSIDRALLTGTLQGIVEGKVAIGNQQLLGSLNVAFLNPINEAIKEAAAKTQEAGAPPNPDIVENRKLIDSICAGIEHAARFGIFIDQPLQVKRGRLDTVGFGTGEANR